MKIEEMVVSIEMAKRLKDIGWRKGTLIHTAFFWKDDSNIPGQLGKSYSLCDDYNTINESTDMFAPIANELIWSFSDSLQISVNDIPDVGVRYYLQYGDNPVNSESGITLQDTLAQLTIKMLKNTRNMINSSLGNL